MRKWICTGALLLLAGCGGDSADNKETQKSTQTHGEIASWILEDYQDNSLIVGSDPSDPTYKKFEQSIPRVNSEKNGAAYLAAKTCAKVDSVLFVRRESTIDNFRFMVDCESGDRMYITSKDIERDIPVKTGAEQAIGKSEAIKECKRMLAEKYPDSKNLEFNELTDSAYSKVGNGNVRLLLGFSYTSAGLSLKGRASCNFDTSWKGDLSIIPR